MKRQKKSLVTIHVMLIAITLLFLATNCAPKNKDKTDPDVTQEFISEYSRYSGISVQSGRDEFTLRPDGHLRYEAKSNAHCIYKFKGHIKKVTAADGRYTISYVYTDVKKEELACVNTYSCQLDYADCRRYFPEQEKALDRSPFRSRIVAQGAEKGSLVLMP